MPDEEDKLVALDSLKSSESLTVAEARHMVRTAFLIEDLNTLNLIGMDPEQKTSDRVAALIFLVKFAEGAEGTDHKFLKKLSPDVAKRIARLGVAQNANRKIDQKALSSGNVAQDGTQRERLGPDGNGGQEGSGHGGEGSG